MIAHATAWLVFTAICAGLLAVLCWALMRPLPDAPRCVHCPNLVADCGDVCGPCTAAIARTKARTLDAIARLERDRGES